MPKFTRYLYEASQVGDSLYIAIRNKSHDESLFWLYELWFSGFSQMAWDICARIACEPPICDIAPHIRTWMKKATNSGKVNTEEIAGTFVLTLLAYVNTKNEKKTKFIIRCLPTQISKFQTITGMAPHELYKYLSIACRYPVYINDADPQDQQQILLNRNALFYHTWYYCQQTPYWAEKFKQYGITFHNMKIIYPSEDAEEEFNNTYYYEPDEQPCEILWNLGVLP